jgi:hypothetical protein
VQRLSAVTIGKEGSNVNYLYEFSAALSLAAGAIIAWPGRRHLLSALLVLALVPQISGMIDWSRSDFYNRAMGKIRFKADILRMENLLLTTGGLVLADEDMAMLPLVNLPIVFQPFEFKMLKEAGLWDDTNPLSNPSSARSTRLFCSTIPLTGIRAAHAGRLPCLKQSNPITGANLALQKQPSIDPGNFRTGLFAILKGWHSLLKIGYLMVW